MAEAMGLAFVDNMTYYGDPDYTDSPANGLASYDFATTRAALIRFDQALPRPIAPGDPWPYESEADAPQELPAEPTMGGPKGTSQVAAADREGNVVSLITSLTSGFGSLVYVPEAGIFLNNSMQNFDPRPDHPNCITPGKMPIFAAPTLVAAKDGQATFAICGSGGYRIMTGVLHTLIHALDFGMEIQRAVDRPRVHCQGEATYVDSRISEAVQERLEEMGHTVVPQEENPGAINFGRVNAIRIDPETGLMSAGSGPAWRTAAAGY
jgi:gamma-glutamyltranspeptidase/glutathione hydrolase